MFLAPCSIFEMDFYHDLFILKSSLKLRVNLKRKKSNFILNSCLGVILLLVLVLLHCVLGGFFFQSTFEHTEKSTSMMNLKTLSPKFNLL